MKLKIHLNVVAAQYLLMKQLDADYQVFLNRDDPDGPRGGFTRAEERMRERLEGIKPFRYLENTNRFQRFTVSGVEYQRVVLVREVTGKNNFLNWLADIQSDWPGTTVARIKNMGGGVEAGRRITKQETTVARVNTQSTTQGGAAKDKTRIRRDTITVTKGDPWSPGVHFGKALPRRNEDVDQTDDDGNVTGTTNVEIVSEFPLDAGEAPDYDLEEASLVLAAEITI